MAPSSREASINLQEQLTQTVEALNKTITRLLPDTDLPEAPLFEAMRYGTLNGGKRLRPFLVIQSAKLFNVDPKRSRRVAAALEFVHCYSLMHDDLPAMDNADLRRGIHENAIILHHDHARQYAAVARHGGDQRRIRIHDASPNQRRASALH